jgi:hypothetical protein
MTQGIPFKIFYKGAGRLLYVDSGIDWNGMANKIVLLFPEAGSAKDIQLFTRTTTVNQLYLIRQRN